MTKDRHGCGAPAGHNVKSRQHLANRGTGAWAGSEGAMSDDDDLGADPSRGPSARRGPARRRAGSAESRWAGCLARPAPRGSWWASRPAWTTHWWPACASSSAGSAWNTTPGPGLPYSTVQVTRASRDGTHGLSVALPVRVHIVKTDRRFVPYPTGTGGGGTNPIPRLDDVAHRSPGKTWLLGAARLRFTTQRVMFARMRGS